MAMMKTVTVLTVVAVVAGAGGAMAQQAYWLPPAAGGMVGGSPGAPAVGSAAPQSFTPGNGAPFGNGPHMGQNPPYNYGGGGAQGGQAMQPNHAGMNAVPSSPYTSAYSVQPQSYYNFLDLSEKKEGAHAEIKAELSAKMNDLKVQAGIMAQEEKDRAETLTFLEEQVNTALDKAAQHAQRANLKSKAEKVNLEAKAKTKNDPAPYWMPPAGGGVSMGMGGQAMVSPMVGMGGYGGMGVMPMGGYGGMNMAGAQKVGMMPYGAGVHMISPYGGYNGYGGMGGAGAPYTSAYSVHGMAYAFKGKGTQLKHKENAHAEHEQKMEYTHHGPSAYSKVRKQQEAKAKHAAETHRFAKKAPEKAAAQKVEAHQAKPAHTPKAKHENKGAVKKTALLQMAQKVLKLRREVPE